MKINVDGNEVFELLEWHEKLIKNDIPASYFYEDMCRRAIKCLEIPIEKTIHYHMPLLINILKNRGQLLVSADKRRFIEELGVIEELGIHLLENERNRDIFVDGALISSLSPSYLRIAVSLMKRDEKTYIPEQINWVFEEKIKGCLRRMRLMWEPKLALRDHLVPLDDEEFVNLVCAQPDYEDRKARDLTQI